MPSHPVTMPVIKNKQAESAGKAIEKEKSHVALMGMKISAATAENRVKRL